MPYKCSVYPLTEKTEIADKIYSYEILCPEVAELSKPGQFVHIRVDNFTLRRPISICGIDKKKGTIRIVFEIRGNGTDKLSQAKVGDELDMIAPLGNGFTIIPELSQDKRIIVVGGGIGVPPLLGVAQEYKDKAVAITGFRTKEKVILSSDFAELGAENIVCTDDGSFGVNGVVTAPLEAELEKGDVAMVYACGPTPMLKAVRDASQKHGVACELSLEQRMACGVGACVGCACNIVRNGKELVLRVCKDGPVFKAEEVVL